MKKKIIREVCISSILYLFITEVLLFAIYCAFPRAFPSLIFSEYIIQYYWIAALCLFALIGIYFGLCILICLKRYNSLCKSQNISDEKLLEYYKAAAKCNQYRVCNDYLFVDAPHGIICMTTKDVSDYIAYEKRHAHYMETTYDDDAAYVSQEKDYYSYHFKVITRYGTFNNTMPDYKSLEVLNKFFEQRITRAS